MSTALVYTVKYVADMDAAVTFFTEHLRLKVRFTSPYWSEFDTGPTTLALHPASAEHPAGSCQLGFRVADVAVFYGEQRAAGVEFTSPPTPLHGQTIARFRDSEGAECSVSG
jgi:lactoylglutathione lyase